MAYDVSTGPGNITEVLDARLDRVIANDPNRRNAGKRLKRFKTFFEIRRAENLLNVSRAKPEDKADLTTLAKWIPLMDAEKAFDRFARMMRPGGTLAVSFYGKPIFDEPGQEKRQAIYDRITAKAIERIFPSKGTSMERAFTT